MKDHSAVLFLNLGKRVIGFYHEVFRYVFVQHVSRDKSVLSKR